MKQIYVGRESRGELQSKIRRILRLPAWVLVGVVALTVIAPFLIKDKQGNYGSVALIETYGGTGSAIFVGNNWLLTAAHVMQGMEIGDRCAVEFVDPNDLNGRSIVANARLVAVGNWAQGDKNSPDDYALVEVTSMDVSRVVKTATLGMSSSAKVKENVQVEGFPYGTYSSTSGVLSNITGGVKNNNDFFVVDAGAWPGNSGGALFNSSNQLIGIVVQSGIQDMQGQTFVLKIDYVVEQLRAKGFVIR